MATHKLTPYWYTMYKKHSSGDWDLSRLSSENPDLPHSTAVGMFEDFCNRYNFDRSDDSTPGYKNIREQQKTFNIKEFESSQDNMTVEGVIATGNYGTGADHLNVTQDEYDENAQSARDSVILPYHFLLHIPEEDPRKALFILQKVGNKGTKGVLETVLEEYLENRTQDNPTNYSFDQIIGQEIADQIEEADRLLNLSLTNIRTADSDQDLLGSIFKSQGEYKNSIEFGNTSGSSLPLDRGQLKDILFNSSRSSVTINEQEFNEGKLTAEINGSRRSFNLFQEEVSMERIVDLQQDNVDTDEQNHPEPGSISEVSREFANEILSEHSMGQISEDSLL